MLGALKEILRRNYRDAPFEIQMKSLILFSWCAILIFILLFLYVINLFTIHSIYSGPLFILLIQLFLVAVSMFLLYRGLYEKAVILLILIFMFGLMLYILLSPPSGNIALYHVNTFYYVFAMIVYCALFGNWKWLVLLAACYFVFGTCYFIYISKSPDLQGVSMAGVIIDYVFSLLLVSSLSIMLRRINGISVARLEIYNKRVNDEMSERMALEKEMMSVNETVQYKIGQDLHDDLGQHLVAIKMRGEALKKLHFPEGSGDTAEIDAIIDLTNQAIKKTRRLMRGLGLIDLKAHNFIKALSDLALETVENYHIPCIFKHDGSIIIYDDLMAINLYRIAQESLHNAVRHGNPKKIGLSMYMKDGSNVMEIQDDGSGFRGKTVDHTGMGLRIMEYRSGLIGGEIEIANNNAGGTTVTCTFTVNKPREESNEDKNKVKSIHRRRS